MIFDVVAAVVFAAIGRLSHGESLAGLAATAWPFAVAAAVGSLVAGRRGGPWWVQGLLAWAITTFGGIGLRFAAGGGVQPGFVVVTAVVLAIFLLGWRALFHRRLTPSA